MRLPGCAMDFKSRYGTKVILETYVHENFIQFLNTTDHPYELYGRGHPHELIIGGGFKMSRNFWVKFTVEEVVYKTLQRWAYTEEGVKN